MATDETTSNTQQTAASSTAEVSISSVMSEKRKFPPPADFALNAHVSSMADYEKLYAAAEAARPASFGSVEWLKDFFQTFLGYAAAAVAEFQAHMRGINQF